MERGGRPAALLQQTGQVNSGEPESLPAAAAAADWQWLAHCTLHSGARGPQTPLFSFYFLPPPFTPTIACTFLSVNCSTSKDHLQKFRSQSMTFDSPISGATPHRSKSSHLARSVSQLESLRCPSCKEDLLASCWPVI